MKRIIIMIFILSLFGCQPSDEQLWKKAKETNTITAYESYLKESKEAAYKDSAKIMIELIDWENFLKTKSKESFNEYLTKYKEGRFRINAKWNIALIENKISCYEDFIEEFPNSEFVKTALDSIKGNKIQWIKEFKNPAFVQNIVVTNKNQIVIIGAAGGLNKAWINILDSIGNTIYEKTNSHPNSSEQYRDIVSLKNGNFMLGGYISGNPNDGIMLSEIEITGKILWEKFHNNFVSGIILDMEYFTENKIIAVGECANLTEQKQKENDLETAKYNILSGLDFLVHKNAIKHMQSGRASSNLISGFVTCLDNKGEILWQKSVSNGNMNSFNKAIITNDSSIIVAGVKNKSSIILYKFNANGDILWNKEFNELGNVSDLVQLSTGEIVASAYKFLHPFDNVFFIKLSSSTGEIIEQKDFKNKNHYVTSIIPTKDSGYIIVGKQEISSNKSNIWIAKFKQNGDLQWERLLDNKFGVDDLRIIKDNKGDLIIAGTIKQLYSSKGIFVLKL